MAEKLKIGMLSFYYPHLGGSGIVTARLASHLSREGHDVHMIGYPGDVNPANMRASGVKLHNTHEIDYPCLKNEPYTMTLASEVANVDDRVGLDVIHANYAIPHAISAYLAKAQRAMVGRDLPYVVTGHGSDIHTNGKKDSVNPMLSLALNSADATTFVSEDLRRIAKEQLGYTGAGEVIPNFVDQDVFHPGESQLRRQMGIPEDDFVIGHVSNFAPVKQAYKFAELASNLRDAGRLDGVHFLMAGDGKQKPGLEEYLAKQGLSENFHFLGQLPAEEISDVYNASDCVALPSRHEGNPLTLLEAMACSVPVIGSRVGGIEETIKGGGGFLFEDGNIPEFAKTVYNLKNNPELARETGREGLEKVRSEYSPDVIMGRYVDLFKGVIENAGK
ncbi:glycosyltransferase [Candidatus Pacearchaeota archaeon]|nr:glycosyltransferase [Candidatus Pacearchaeota archaeon]